MIVALQQCEAASARHPQLAALESIEAERETRFVHTQSQAKKRIKVILLVLETTGECSFLFAQTKRPGLRLSRS